MPSSPQIFSSWPEFSTGHIPTAPGSESVERKLRNATSAARPTPETGLLDELDVAVATATTLDQLLARVTEVMQGQSSCLGFWAVYQSSDDAELELRSLAESQIGVKPGQVKQWLDHSQPAAVRLYPHSTSQCVAVAPLSLEVKICAPLIGIVGIFGLSRASKLRVEWLMGLIKQAIQKWSDNQALLIQRQRNKSLTDMFAIVEGLNQSQSVSEAAKVIANQLQRLTGGSMVAVALGTNASQLRLEAISGVEQIESNSDASQALLSACRQPLLKQANQVFLGTEGEDSGADLVYQQFCNLFRQQACIAVELVAADGKRIGTMVIGHTADRLRDEIFVNHLSAMCQMLTGYLAIVLKANESLVETLRRSVRKCATNGTMRTIVSMAGLLVLLAMIPAPYRMNCECELQPVLRRFIAAPHEGILQSSMVESGDLVRAGQVIARLDGRQIRIELAGVAAEVEGARKRRDLALAQGNIAQAQIAKSEMQRFEAKRNLLTQRLGNLEIRSPIDGWVVTGDLDKVQGAPVELGQTLFEIAPLETMVAEVAIPEEEIRFVDQGMDASLKLNSFPFRSFSGTLQRMNLRAEIRDEHTVFIGEVRLENADRLLKPGMEGRAKINTGWSTLGWQLFHRPWESVRYWSVW